MKQHITENDLNQLTNSGKEKLLGWLVINEYAVLEDDNNWTFITPTIGQMIEFLDGKFINFWRTTENFKNTNTSHITRIITFIASFSTS